MTLPHMNPSKRQHYVYRAYDTAGDLLYIGCTVSIKRRWQEHRKSAWASEAARFKIAGPFTYDAARHLEQVAIATEQPAFNHTTPQRKSAEAAHRAAFDAVYYQALSEGVPTGDALKRARASVGIMPADNRMIAA